jgi:hypothetical protein
MVRVQAQFHIFVHWELAESALHDQDAIIPRYGGVKAEFHLFINYGVAESPLHVQDAFLPR